MFVFEDAVWLVGAPVAAQRAVDHNPKKIDETDSDEDRQYFEWF
jgi:hypothetical protein